MFSPRRKLREEEEQKSVMISPKKQAKVGHSTPTALRKNLGHNTNTTPSRSPRTPPRSVQKESAFITSSPRSQPRKTKAPASRYQRLTRSASGTMFSPTFKNAAKKNGCSAELPLEPTSLFGPQGGETVVEPLSPVRQRLEENVRLYGQVPQDFDEYDEEEFDPYRFIASLPPLSNSVISRRPCLPPKSAYRNTHAITLVLDLDETLVHCSTDEDDLPNPDFVFQVEFNNTVYHVRARKRPGFDEFLEHVKDKFEVVVFTASQKVYADQLLNILDPHREFIKHRVFRDDCVCVEGNYLKDLTVLGRDLSKTVIVDNSPQAFSYQIDNGIPILSWFDYEDDKELFKIIPFIDSLRNLDDVRPAVHNKFKLYKKVEARVRQLGYHEGCYPENQHQPDYTPVANSLSHMMAHTTQTATFLPTYANIHADIQ